MDFCHKNDSDLFLFLLQISLRANPRPYVYGSERTDGESFLTSSSESEDSARCRTCGLVILTVLLVVLLAAAIAIPVVLTNLPEKKSDTQSEIYNVHYMYLNNFG